MNNKKAVFILAPEKFRDEEYLTPKEILEAAGVKTVTASTVKDLLVGTHGIAVENETLINEIKPENFDAVIFVGGAGANVYFENETALNLARAFYNAGKITAAICIAPVILANAGILTGKKATVFPDGIETLKKGNALYTGEPAVTSGNIITGRDYQSATAFANAVLAAL